jgi:hypothetical protein
MGNYTLQIYVYDGDMIEGLTCLTFSQTNKTPLHKGEQVPVLP